MTDDVKTNVKSKSTWTRLVFIILFAITYRIASIVLFAITIIQFLKALFTGSPFPQLQSFGGSLAEYNKQVVEFLSYQSEEKPFPVGPWPEQPAAPAQKADDVIIVAEPVEEASEKKKPATKKKSSKDDSDQSDE
ncbi:DUF4389 domain-containing protein [Sneathiella marina]|uniref:DUF4389 domain-containing protein n=1 Tax=Sneathiella marina TaxID=2950108 RepID=A0ABY4W4R0_9PROT|nr:DUF4389 domain-containing protein [Sneathiella marina]USG61831.1 DUF4389 domain-containing protein [Sneathiella marina]